MNQEHLDLLIEKYRNGLCNDEEKSLLINWYNSLPTQNFQLDDLEKKELLNKISNQISVQEQLAKPRLTIQFLKPLAKIAAVLLVAFLGYYAIRKSVPQTKTPSSSNVVQAIQAPKEELAIITLANGKKIELNRNDQLKINEINGLTITKAKDGKIIYTANAHTKDKDGYNTVETPRGSKYNIQLPDGSNIWLNASSKISFQINMLNQNIRSVILDGEAYFEVKKMPEKPFIVNSNGQEVKVLGTTFNISAYKNEPIITTLLTGRVQLNQTHILTPNHQAINNHSNIQISAVVATEAIDWKNGLFVFNNESLTSIMNKISRWYDVETSYKISKPEEIKFNGTISRYGNLDEVLNMLSSTSTLSFQVKNRNITIENRQTQ